MLPLANDPEYEAFLEGFKLLNDPDVSHLQVSRQEAIESQYDRKHLDAKMRRFLLENEDSLAKVTLGAKLILQWLVAPSTYPAKAERKELLAQAMGLRSQHLFEYAAYELMPEELAQVEFTASYEDDDIDLGDSALDERLALTGEALNNLVLEVFTCTASLIDPMPLVSVAAILAPRLNVVTVDGAEEQTELQAVTLAGELLAILTDTEAFDLVKPARYASITFENRIVLPMRITAFILEHEYLPPMVCKPLELTHNFSSGYLTHNDSLILQRGNHHDGEICLDVLNRMNSVALSLNTEFLSTVEEEPNHPPATPLEQRQWDRFKRQSYRFYLLMMRCGNRFFFCHKIDKRGRIYACGYHLHSQGAPFKRASIELARKELVEGAPA